MEIFSRKGFRYERIVREGEEERETRWRANTCHRERKAGRECREGKKKKKKKRGERRMSKVSEGSFVSLLDLMPS